MDLSKEIDRYFLWLTLENRLVYDNHSIKKFKYFIERDMDNFGTDYHIGLRPIINKHVRDFRYDIEEFLEIDYYFFVNINQIDFLKIIYHKLLENNKLTKFKSIKEMLEFQNGVLSMHIKSIYISILCMEFNKNPQLAKPLQVKKTLFGWKSIRAKGVSYASGGDSDYYERFFK